MAEDKEKIVERAEKFIAEYQESYSKAISEAREASATTATPAWQSSYSEQVATHDKCVRHYANEIQTAGRRIQDFDTTEVDEKCVKDAVKGLQEERASNQAWRNRAVMPFESKANRCAELLQTIHREAQRLEQDVGLVNHGLSAEVSKIVSKWPVAEWNDGAGVVVITEPLATDAKQAGGQ